MSTPLKGPLAVLSALGNILFRNAAGRADEVDTASAVDGDILTRVAGIPAWAAGGGGSDLTQVGMEALTETNLGVFANITAQLTSEAGSAVAIIPSLPAGSAFYLGGNTTFPGFFIDDTIAMVLGAGAVVVEVSTGPGTWVAIRHMSADDTAVAQYAEDIFERINKDEVYFGNTPGWVSATVSGIAKFWMRVRVTAAITTAPSAEQTKLQMNATRFAPTTMKTNFFGEARANFRLLSSIRTKDDLGGPKNEEIKWSTNITADAKDNLFENDEVDALVNGIVIPNGIDTSFPLVLTFGWSKDTVAAGNVQWFLRQTAVVAVGDSLDNTIVDTEQSLIVAAGAVDVLQQSVLSIDVSQFVPGVRLALQFRRDATAGNLNDTYEGGAYLVDFEVRGRVWKL